MAENASKHGVFTSKILISLINQRLSRLPFSKELGSKLQSYLMRAYIYESQINLKTKTNKSIANC